MILVAIVYVFFSEKCKGTIFVMMEMKYEFLGSFRNGTGKFTLVVHVISELEKCITGAKIKAW